MAATAWFRGRKGCEWNSCSVRWRMGPQLATQWLRSALCLSCSAWVMSSVCPMSSIPLTGELLPGTRSEEDRPRSDHSEDCGQAVHGLVSPVEARMNASLCQAAARLPLVAGLCQTEEIWYDDEAEEEDMRTTAELPPGALGGLGHAREHSSGLRPAASGCRLSWVKAWNRASTSCCSGTCLVGCAGSASGTNLRGDLMMRSISSAAPDACAAAGTSEPRGASGSAGRSSLRWSSEQSCFLSGLPSAH